MSLFYQSGSRFQRLNLMTGFFFFYGEVEILQGTEDIMNMVYSTLLSMFNTFSACCSGKLLKFPHMQVLIGHSDV